MIVKPLANRKHSTTVIFVFIITEYLLNHMAPWVLDIMIPLHNFTQQCRQILDRKGDESRESREHALVYTKVMALSRIS